MLLFCLQIRSKAYILKNQFLKKNKSKVSKKLEMSLQGVIKWALTSIIATYFNRFLRYNLKSSLKIQIFYKISHFHRFILS